jgi:hypothetical protein
VKKHMDTGSIIVTILTLGLFIAALFVKGMTHDLFLEIGVFLVSVKIIIMSYKNSLEVRELNVKLDAITTALAQGGSQTSGDAA